MNCLVIEKDQTWSDAICFLIEGAGHSAEGVPTTGQAFERLKENEFDALLLDLEFDQTNGLDLLSEILRAQADLPVVVFVAENSAKIAVEAIQRGAVDFLEKPFQREQILAVVARLQRLSQLNSRIDRLEGMDAGSRA
jgi:NtrC-family two-component system response regulator AlgB